MDVVYYVVIPIITSLFGGIVVWLFTFLHERKTRKEDLKIRQEDQKKQENEKIIERNKRIILTRPELTLTKNSDQIKAVEEFCLLPYEKPKLLDEEKMTFGYTDEIFNEDYWDKYEINLQNTGKREILVSFLQAPYDSKVNIYSKIELFGWQYAGARNYYNDERLLISNLHPDEKIKIIIYYPKNAKELGKVPLDVFMNDEDGNCWIQPYVNLVREFHSDVLAPDAFNMHLHQECNKWYVYDYLYRSKDTVKCFKRDIHRTLDRILEERNNSCRNKEDKYRKFVWDVNNGVIPLKYNLPLN